MSKHEEKMQELLNETTQANLVLDMTKICEDFCHEHCKTTFEGECDGSQCTLCYCIALYKNGYLPTHI